MHRTLRASLARSLAGILTAGLLLATSSAVASARTSTTIIGSAPTSAVASGPCAAQWLAVSTDPSLANLQALGNCEINRRLTTLANLKAGVSTWPSLTASDRSALLAEIQSTASGLTALEASIDADTTVAAARADLAKIAPDYRVYLLVVPQVELVRGADALMSAVGRFGTLSTQLAARIAAEKAAGKDVAAAQAALDAMNANVAQASTMASPLPGQLLPLTPAQYNAGTAGPVLEHAREAELSARSLLLAARDDAAACIADLR